MGDFERTVREFKRTLTGGRQKTAPLDIMGKVTRVEDGVAWVRFAGSEVGDTPVRMNIDCKVGDVVQVRSSDGKAWIVGNQTAPPTDDSKAEEVEKKTEKFAERIKDVEKAAGDAEEVANAVNQKVWSDEAGLHIADGKKNAAAERNSIWNSLGMLFRKGLNPILGILTGDSPRVAIYDGQGSASENEVASFGESARVGKSSSSHVYVENNRIAAEYGHHGAKYYEVGLIEEEDPSLKITDEWVIEEYTEGKIFQLSYYPIGNLSASVNGETVPVTQTDDRQYAYIPNELFEGDEVAIVYYTYGANGYFTLGVRKPSAKIGISSFSAGRRNAASGRWSASFGSDTEAIGVNSLSAGAGTKAKGIASAAFGTQSEAERANSMAVGYKTITKSFESVAIGRLNKEDTDGNYAFIVGNGNKATNERSNAFSIDWNGNVKAKGDIYVNCDADSSGTAHIGQVFNWQGNLKSNLTANAGAYVEGDGSIALKGGHTYLVLAYVAMTNSTNGSVDRRAQIFNKTANSVVLTGDKFVASQVWGTVETQTIYEATNDVTLTVRGSASRPTTTIPTAWIRAVCIA